MDEGPESNAGTIRYAITEHTRLVFALNIQGRIDEFEFDDLSRVFAHPGRRSSAWIDPHRLGNACLLYGVAKDLGIVPGLFECGDQKLREVLFERISPRLQDPEHVVQTLIKDWQYVLNHPTARPFAIRNRPFYDAQRTQGASLGCFGSFELFVRLYFLALARGQYALNLIGDSNHLIRTWHYFSAALHARLFYPNTFVCFEELSDFLEQATFDVPQVSQLQPLWANFIEKKNRRKGKWWCQNEACIKFYSEDFGEINSTDYPILWEVLHSMLHQHGLPPEHLEAKVEGQGSVEDMYDSLSGLNTILLDPVRNGYLHGITKRDEQAISYLEIQKATQAHIYWEATQFQCLGRYYPRPDYLQLCAPSEESKSAAFEDEAYYKSLPYYQLYAISQGEHALYKEIALKVLKSRLLHKQLVQEDKKELGSTPKNRRLNRCVQSLSQQMSMMRLNPQPSEGLGRVLEVKKAGDGPFLPSYRDFCRAQSGESGRHALPVEAFEFELYDFHPGALAPRPEPERAERPRAASNGGCTIA